MSKLEKEKVKIETTRYEKLVMSLVWLVCLAGSVATALIAYALLMKGAVVAPILLSLTAIFLLISATETLLEFLDNISGLL
jgi:hypothetical protein